MHPNLEQFSGKVASAIDKIDRAEFPVAMERVLTEAKLQLSVLEHIAPRFEIFDFVLEVVTPLGYILNKEKKFDLPPTKVEHRLDIPTPSRPPTYLPRQPNQRVEKKGSKHKSTSKVDEFGDHEK